MLILIRYSAVGIINLKFLLTCFEAMSRLKINFDKSEAMVLGCDREDQLRAAHMMNCKLRSLPIKYLGMLVSNKVVRVEDFDLVVDKVAGRVEPSQGVYWHPQGGWCQSMIASQIFGCLSWCFTSYRMGYMTNLTGCSRDSFGKR